MGGWNYVLGAMFRYNGEQNNVNTERNLSHSPICRNRRSYASHGGWQRTF